MCILNPIGSVSLNDLNNISMEWEDMKQLTFHDISAIRRKENGWYDEEHPLVFLFLGSSGIGLYIWV